MNLMKLLRRVAAKSARKAGAALFQAEFEKEALTRAGLVPINQYDARDVFLVGYPKSGNTWFQNLVVGVMYGITTERVPDSLIKELVPDVNMMKYYRRFYTPTVFKSHELPKPEYRRVVYLIRDGRDVLVSYLYHIRALQSQELDGVEAARSGKGLFFGRWHEHIQAWQANPYHAEMLVIRYEDLQENAGRELGRFCEFIGVDRSPDAIGAAVSGASFEKMKKQEATFGWANPTWPRDKTFLRRGKIGSYRDELPPEVLEAFLKVSRPTLEQLKYMARTSLSV